MQEEEELVFLYQLVDGHADSSFACHIACLAGVPDELIKRAHQVRRVTLARCAKVQICHFFLKFRLGKKCLGHGKILLTNFRLHCYT